MTAQDKAMLWIAAALALGGMYYGFHGLAGQHVGLRVLSVLGGPAAAAALVYFSEPGRVFIAYCGDASLEVRKVVWPKREETLRMVGVVVLFVGLVALFLWLVDSVIRWLLSLLTL